MFFILLIVYFVLSSLYILLMFLYIPGWKEHKKKIFPFKDLSKDLSKKQSDYEDKDILWLHGVSAGELASLEYFASLARKGFRLLITTNTKSGLVLAKRIYKEDKVSYFPYDNPIPVYLYLKRIKPKAVCFAEVEVWPFFLLMAKLLKIKTYMINGHIGDDVIRRYKRLKLLFSKVFNCHNHLFVQTQKDCKGLMELGILGSKINIIDNLKFDILVDSRLSGIEKRFLEQEEFLGKKYIVAGSVHGGEYELVLDSFTKLLKRNDKLFLILAPRDVKEALKCVKASKERGFKTILLSEYIRGGYKGVSLYDILLKVLVVDIMGELVSFYKLSDIVILGGTLIKGLGGHNPLEAMHFGKAVLVGPYYESIEYIVNESKKERGLIVCDKSFEGVKSFIYKNIRKLVLCPGYRKIIGNNAKDVFKKRRNGSKKTYELIKSSL